MSIKSIIVLAALALGSGLAVASEATQFANEPSVLTRAEVRAELARARANGELDVPGAAYGSFKASDLRSSRDRDDVRAQAAGGGYSRGDTRLYVGG